jgi:hypothetical protein
MDKQKLLEVIERLESIVMKLNNGSRSDLSWSTGDIEDISKGTEFQYLIDAVYTIVDGIEHLDYLVSELKEKYVEKGE